MLESGAIRLQMAASLPCPPVPAAPSEWVAWQPLIAALAAVAAALVANTILEWIKQYLGHRHKAKIVRRALLSELRLLRETAQANMAPESAPQSGFTTMVPLIKLYPIFDKALSDIGYLTNKEASLVYTAYAFFYDIPRRLYQLGVPQPLTESVAIPFSAYPSFVQICRGIDHHANGAIAAMEKRLK